MTTKSTLKFSANLTMLFVKESKEILGRYALAGKYIFGHLLEKLLNTLYTFHLCKTVFLFARCKRPLVKFQKLRNASTTLQSIMNAKLSKQRF